MDSISLKIAAPNSYTEYSKISSISLPAKEGVVTILPKHENLILEINSGTIKITGDKKNFEIQINQSIAYIDYDSVMIIKIICN